ncbi:hypothetical protein NVS55_40150 (plasmid) [Myxococcus stipitatus]|uniref:hypothetical protein n=1 Tax=Myxococcus stipitatus TaxID=83455 RepID=UPI0031451B6C
MTAPSLTVFNSVLGGPTTYFYAAGWTMIGVGFTSSLALDAMTNALTGEKSKRGEIVVRLFLCIGAMLAYTAIANGIWWFFQATAAEVYPHSALGGLSNLMMVAVRRYQDYSFNALSVVSSAKEGLVIFGSLASFIIALLGYWNTQTFQVIGFNVIFALGPLLIALTSFGIPGIRTWILLLVELSSWTVIQAVIFRTIEGRLIYYLRRAAELPVLSIEFLDIFSQLAVLATLPVVVPALAGRLFGMGAGAAFASAPNSVLSPQVLGAALGGYFGSRTGSSHKGKGGGDDDHHSGDSPQRKSESRRGGDV